MKETTFSLMTVLLAVINESEPNEPYYVLAQYFLLHFNQLSKMNIYDVADACFVSRSCIRRFCQSIGYDNFSELKMSEEWKRQCNYFVTYSTRPNYKDYLSQSITSMMSEINRLAAPAVLDSLNARIHAARQVVLITSDFSGMAARSFQQAMIVMGKLVRILTDAHGGISQLSDLQEEDLLITVSATGNFATIMQPIVEKTPCGKVLFTVNRAKRFWTVYDQVIYLSEEDNSSARTVYAQYGMTYFFDILYNRYVLAYRGDLQQGPFDEPPLFETPRKSDAKPSN